MALTIEQQDEIDRIKRKRKREAYFMATLDFLSVVATLVCVYSDAIAILGISLVLAGPIGLGLGLMIGVLAVSIIAGMFWARKKFKEYNQAAKDETVLMEEAYDYGITENDLVPAPEKLSFAGKAMKYISKAGNRIMSMFFNFGTMLGLAGVIFGAASITLIAALTPVGWGVLIAAGIFAVAFGVASVISEYYVTRARDEHKEMLNSTIKNKLETKVTDLKNENDALKGEKNNLETSRKGLESEVFLLKAKVQQLEKEKPKWVGVDALTGSTNDPQEEILKPSKMSMFKKSFKEDCEPDATNLLKPIDGLQLGENNEISYAQY